MIIKKMSMEMLSNILQSSLHPLGTQITSKNYAKSMMWRIMKRLESTITRL